MDEFRSAVGAARTEDDVVAWLRERIDPATVEETNRKLESFTSERMTPEDRALLEERHPVLRERPELTSILDILDAEDARAFRQADLVEDRRLELLTPCMPCKCSTN